MGIFIFLVILTIFFSIFYLLRFSRNKKFFLFSFCFIFFASLIIYNFKGNKNSFSYSNKLEKQIRVLSKDPEKFADLNPKEIVFFLENKLKKKTQ